MSKSISQIFDVTPVPIKPLAVVKVKNESIESDAAAARDNLRSLAETARVALENALSIAIQSESPRGFEVVANLLNTAADLNTKLLNTHQITARIKETEKQINTPELGHSTTNNVIFNGTPSELAKLLKGASK